MNPPFTRFVMEHRPLNEALSRYGRLVLTPIAESRTLAALDMIEANLEKTLSSVRPELPRLGAGGAGRYDEAHHFGKRRDDGSAPAVTRFMFRREVVGAAGLLSRWPTGVELEPIDRDIEHEHLRSGDPVWSIGQVGGEGSPWAVYTPIDLTSDEVDLVSSGDLALQALYDSREGEMIPILKAIVSEAERYFDEELPDRARSSIAARRAQLLSFETVRSAISFPESWKLPEPQMRVDADNKPASDDLQKAIVFRDRLATASFEDLQRSIRVWANAVERYPAAFNLLAEDRVSDLLAATLNASLPRADREVFSTRGKSDIRVLANAIDDGSAEAIIFIAETKWVTSESVVVKALDPQLFSYLNAADTAAVLLLLFRQKDRGKAYKKYLPPLEAVRGYIDQEDSAVAGWKVNRYRRDGREVRLLVATVAIPSA